MGRVRGMVEAALLIERKTFEEMVRFVMKAIREGIPEEEIWATLEVMSSRELQADIAESLKEIHEGKVMRFRSAKEALEWLKSYAALALRPDRFWDLIEFLLDR